MSVELKVKSKTLEAESKIIREEVAKSKRSYQYHKNKQDFRKAKAANFRTERLAQHRRTVVRWEAHATFIARSFLEGRKYSDHSPKRGNRGWHTPGQYTFSRVYEMVAKYGNMSYKEAQDKVGAWKVLTS